MRLPRKAMVGLVALSMLAQAKEDADALAASRDLHVGLSGVQREYVTSDSKRRVVTGGRRSGKTESFVVECVAKAAKGGRCLYLSLTRSLAEETIWERLLERLRELGLEFRTNLTKLRIKLASGGIIQLGGCHTTKEIDKHRGKAWDLVIVDECGAQPSENLKYLIEDAIGPTLADYEGQLTLGGTPSPVLSGYWADQASPNRKTAHPRWEWTIYDNPFFEGREDRILAEIREENAWDEDSVSYRREYLGQWVQDDGVLVYPFKLARNGLDALPTESENGYPIPHREWRYVIGIDVGTTKDAMALVVWAKNPALADEFIIHAEAHTGMIAPGLAQRVRVLRERYRDAQVVIDPGSIGAPYIIALRDQYGISVTPAKKDHRRAAIRMMRDRVLAGRVKVLNFAAMDGLREEWSILGWDDDHLDHHESQTDHYSDAAMYGLRLLRNWHHDADRNKPKPPPDSPEAMAEAMRREALADEKRMGLRGRRKRPAIWG